MTITESEAFDAMLSHHQRLCDEVARRVNVVRSAVEAGMSHEPAAAELVAYAADEVLPHAVAEEHTVYQAAAAHRELAATITEMIAEHRLLTSLLETLANASEAPVAAAVAEEIGTLFALHVAKENDLLLPPLQADESIDLAQLLIRMHRLTEAAQEAEAAEEDAAKSDPEGTLLGLLLNAAKALSDAGQGDKACRLAAEAWAALRVPRPDLAVRITAALHRLVRSLTAEPVSFVTDMHEGVAGTTVGQSNFGETLDVRHLAPAQRHETIFATYGALGPDAAFVLVNDHDPKPLRYQFEAEHAGAFTWDTLEAGPQVWRVRIGRPAIVGGSDQPSEVTEGFARTLDVRPLPHGQRHESIFAAFGLLASGTAFVLVNDHDPRPLRYQFEAQHGDAFTWDYLESGPTVWRVRIGRPEEPDR